MTEEETIEALRPFAAMAECHAVGAPDRTVLWGANKVDPITGERQPESVKITLGDARAARDAIDNYERENDMEPTMPPLPDLPKEGDEEDLIDDIANAVGNTLGGIGDALGGRRGNRN